MSNPTYNTNPTYSFRYKDKGKKIKCECGKMFAKNSANHKYCKECAKQRAKQRQRGRRSC